MLTAMCSATSPTSASSVRGHEKAPSKNAAAAPDAIRVTGSSRKGARATPAKAVSPVSASITSDAQG
jgi:hypothetical protein